MLNADTRIIDLTVGELQALIAAELQKGKKEIFETLPSRMNTEPKQPVGILYGLDGMAKALGCSISKVSMMKRDGKLEGGYQQYGNTIVVRDPQVLRDIAAQSDKKARKRNRTTQSIIH